MYKKKFSKLILIATLLMLGINTLDTLQRFSADRDYAFHVSHKNADKLLNEEQFIAGEKFEKNKPSKMSSIAMHNIISEKERSEMLLEMKKNKQKIDRQEELQDIEVGKILANLLADQAYKDLAKSVEKADRIKVMHAIVKNIDSFKVDPEKRQKLHSYVLSYGPYTDDAELLQYVDLNKGKDYIASAAKGLTFYAHRGYRHLDAAYLP